MFNTIFTVFSLDHVFAMWPNDKVLKFIEDYQACSCLWDVNRPDYKNRVKRKSAIESLAAKYEVSVADIEKKIHNLKTSFSRERKKIHDRQTATERERL